ncbi:STAS domain-containing protein [Mycobacterium riyadhense]|uniref:Anti-sigma factor antagonist n=1 Tax=Mycobacterium riyadhense TaxID=486698 RepID=A0A1X2CY46_9MYCO|nr:STAS domain-containing protein [Mycobacterium riyadhense]MCV7145317.1 STAS domain-containing protein [Mycobacterium riyadhense]ORW80339.1 anti-anti-sigma factor [Mycobacterium riyadhense]VTP00580.1 Anti-sigma-F factor antagonist RsfB [Mycobacterium riyadhense]
MIEQSGAPGDSRAFGIAERQVDRAIVLTVSGEVDMLTAPRLDAAIHTALAAKPPTLIVDLSKVEFLASAGISVLVAAHAEALPRTRFAVVADAAATSRPIKLMGIDAVVPLYRELDSALSGNTDYA